MSAEADHLPQVSALRVSECSRRSMMLTNGSDEERSNKYLAIPTAETQNILVSEFDIGV